MIIVIASVHHTGTNFLHNHLFAGMRQLPQNRHSFVKGFPVPTSGCHKVRCHIEPENIDNLFWWLNKAKIIVPLRHPEKVAVSWKARDKPLSDMLWQFQAMKRVFAEHEPLYLPIDSPRREDYLRALGQAIRKPLQTSWPVVSSLGKIATLSDDDREIVAEVMADGFFDRFYED